MFLTISQALISAVPCSATLALSDLRSINAVPALGGMGSRTWSHARVPLVCFPADRLPKGVG